MNREDFTKELNNVLQNITARRFDSSIAEYVPNAEYQEIIAKHGRPSITPIQNTNLRQPTQVELAAQYARAELTHATQGPASEADALARLAICMACEHRAVEYKGMTDAGGVGWCTKCGCNASPRALLTVKVTLAGVECPLAKWSKVSGTGASVASAVDAVTGVAKSIIHKLGGG